MPKMVAMCGCRTLTIVLCTLSQEINQGNKILSFSPKSLDCPDACLTSTVDFILVISFRYRPTPWS